MKATIGFILFLGLLPLSAVAQSPKLTVDNAIHKFEDTKEGVLLTHTFTITNTGDAPLIINDYKVACPCTKVELPSQPVLPGKSVKLKMSFDTKGKTYLQDRTIILQTNTKKKEEKVRFKVFVIPENEG
jgi:hypothetical protein